MLPERTVLDLIGLIYSAITHPESRQEFLGKFGESLETTANALFIQDLHQQEVNRDLVVVGFEPSYVKSYVEHYVKKNLYLSCGRRRLVQGAVCRSEELCPQEILTKSEFFNEWLAPQKLGRFLIGVVRKKKSVASCLAMVRSEGMRPFSEQDRLLMKTLLPHLRRALQISQGLAVAEMRQQALTEVFDRLALGVIVLDNNGKSLLHNRSAEAILNQEDGLSLHSDGLRAAVTNDTAGLRNLIHEAAETSLGRGVQAGGTMALPRPSLKRPLNILVSPLAALGPSLGGTRAAAVVFVSDPEVSSETQPDLIAHLFGLTHREADLASVLMQGKGTKESAKLLRVSQNTVRFHLKHLFDKTGARRQSELVRLLLSSPACGPAQLHLP